MTSYATAIGALEAWAKAGTGLALAILENEPRPFTDPAFVLLGPPTISTQGVDQLDYEEIDPLHPELGMGEVVRGSRLLSMTIAVEAFSQDPAYSGPAYLSELQARLSLPFVRANLEAAGLALVDASEIRAADYLDPEDRWISRAEMDVRVCYGIEVRPPAGEATPSIASAVVSTDYQGDVPPALEMDEEIPPP